MIFIRTFAYTCMRGGGRMKNRMILYANGILALFVAITGSITSFAVSAGEPSVSAQAAVVMVAETGEVVFAKNETKKMSMASTTKIMTALLAVESGKPDLSITVTPEMVQVEGTSMGLRAGDAVTMKALTYGMLLESGNDAANVTAIALAGSIEEFAEMMNYRAAQIGMKQTCFVTPSGLDDTNHYSTAYDMALLGSAAVQNPAFTSVCSQTEAKVIFGTPPRERTLSNHNRLLEMCAGAIGIKTGYTKKSGRCLVSAAARNGVTLVAVTLKAPSDWEDHEKLYDYYFDRLTPKPLDADLSTVRLPVAGGEKAECAVGFAAPPKAATLRDTQIKREIRLNPMQYAPVHKGVVVGEAVYEFGGGAVLRVPLIALEDIAASAKEEPAQKMQKERKFQSMWGKVKKFFERIFS
jgi:D-alanyl-D-alanine carboxypeptidase/D-alanyl-D-alanine carboxypeptidase (penicillin-binding protein 5/6)